MKQPKCCICKQPFVRLTSLQKTCTEWACLRELIEQRKQIKARLELKTFKAANKTKGAWEQSTQKIFNLWIRWRDRDVSIYCPSCGRYEHEIEQTFGGKWDCGHFLSVGSHPELRFEELNAVKQCKKCNGGSGNWSKKNRTVSENYEIELIKRIGQDKVDWLKSKHEPKKYTIDDLKLITKMYKERLKEVGKNG